MVVKYLKFVLKNYLFAALSMIFAIMYAVSASKLPAKSLTFSKPVLYCLIPLFIWNIVKSVIDFRKTVADTETPEKEKWSCSMHITKPKLIVTLATIAYVALLPVGGFLLCTALYLGGLAWYLGIRKSLKLILFVGLYTAVVYAIFGLWLNVRLPASILF